jgi:L-threonylcarbamoyladenylate synthase
VVPLAGSAKSLTPEIGSLAPALLADAVARLRAGQLVAFPTETVYGLGADASNPAAVQRIFALKGRPSDHPVIVHLPDATHLTRWAAEIPQAAVLLARKFWPGPLTLILRKAATVDLAVTGGQDSIGLRVPAHPFAQALLKAFGGGVAAPSANRYGHVSPTTAAHVLAEFGADAPLVLDGGACAVGIESTIVDARGSEIRILRPGMLGADAISAALRDLPSVSLISGPTADAPRVPGSTAAHYAPNIPLQLVASAQFHQQLRELTNDGRIAVIALRPPPVEIQTALTSGRIVWRQLAPEAMQYAHDLYATLRDLESTQVSRILVEMPPADADWQALRDRLTRAAQSDLNSASTS